MFDPIRDMELRQHDMRKPLGECEHCGHPVYRADEAEWEDDMPYSPEPNLLLHERCIMPYAKEMWRV